MTAPNDKRYQALLVDLDGTLLDLDHENFLRAYIEALAGKFSAYLSTDNFIRHLFEAINVMLENHDPQKYNETVFYEEFCRRIGQSRRQIQPLVDDFYRHDFPKLNSWGSEHPYASRVIEKAKNKNLICVLATDPVFPAAATLQRLSWSGLSPADFQLITTMENMHFCKPNPAYYLEIAEAINCPPHQCLMAGNDTLEDLIASEAGMDTFLVEDLIFDRGNEEPTFTYRGKLQDLARFIDGLPESS